MKIEAVTVCIGYGDFLLHSAKYNAAQFDRWIIVTEPSDEETREVCRKYSIECLLSKDGKSGGNFVKGVLIERALQHLSKDGWRVHIDADIVLPNRTKMLLEAAKLEEECIYGCDRIMIKSYEEWEKLLSSGWLYSSHDFHNRLNWPVGFQPGSRWVGKNEGWVPIGFFQMWSGASDIYKGVRIKRYPSNHNDACRTDVQHALQWDRNNRKFIPELIVVHLESEKAKLGANWKGRTTKRFGSPNPLMAKMDNIIE